MDKAEDHAMGDERKDYCVHCARPDGSMQSYDEKLDSMAQFFLKSQKLDKATARSVAGNMMSDLPAWKDHFRA